MLAGRIKFSGSLKTLWRSEKYSDVNVQICILVYTKKRVSRCAYTGMYYAGNSEVGPPALYEVNDSKISEVGSPMCMCVS